MLHFFNLSPANFTPSRGLSYCYTQPLAQPWVLWGLPSYVADRVIRFAPQSPGCPSLPPACCSDKMQPFDGAQVLKARLQRTSSCPVITAPDSFPRGFVLQKTQDSSHLQPGPDTRASLGAQIFLGGKIKDPAPLKRQEFGLWR